MSSNEADTKPTLETVLERIADFRKSVETRFEGIETRLDRIESVAYLTKSEMADLRLEFREWRKELKEHLPATS